MSDGHPEIGPSPLDGGASDGLVPPPADLGARRPRVKAALTAMAGVLEASGLEIARFNEIATAVSSDAHLRARVELADARRAAGA